MKLKVTVNGTTYDVDVEVEEEKHHEPAPIIIGGGGAMVTAPTTAKAPAGESSGLRAPIAGTVLRINVQEGQEVKAGDTVVVLEAMKMETEITAPADGTVAHVLVAEGESVMAGQPVVDWA